MIVYDPRNTRARETFDKLLVHLPDGVPGDDLVVVVGGDGFLLRTVAQTGFRFTYLGINAGHLGFLLNDVDDAAWGDVARQILDRTFDVHRFPLLHATTLGVNGTVEERAINDIYLERMTSQAAHLQLTIDGHVVVQRLVADGVVFSTALGSTAYAFSAGGPVCHPTLRMLLVAPICPHRPRLAPFALPATARARVDILDPDRRPVRAVADGRAIPDVRHVTIDYAGSEVRLATLAGHDFTSRMVRKILHP